MWDVRIKEELGSIKGFGLSIWEDGVVSNWGVEDWVVDLVGKLGVKWWTCEVELVIRYLIVLWSV